MNSPRIIKGDLQHRRNVASSPNCIMHGKLRFFQELKLKVGPKLKPIPRPKHHAEAEEDNQESSGKEEGSESKDSIADEVCRQQGQDLIRIIIAASAIT